MDLEEEEVVVVVLAEVWDSVSGVVPRPGPV